MRLSVRFFAIGLFAFSPWTIGAAPGADTAPNASQPSRWTYGDPDAMVDSARDRAGEAEAQSLTAVAIIEALAERASYGRATRALEAIIQNEHVPWDMRQEAALANRRLAPNDGSPKSTADNRQNGIVTAVALLGPFRDTGGGLDLHEGPESPGASFTDPALRYSWGSVEVAWRTVPPAFLGAKGLPLDVFVEPRKESCSYVATTLRLSTAQPIVVRIAASGQVRLVFDGMIVGRSEEVHQAALFDRLAARIDAAVGNHLLYAKVCTGALDDDGRVRIRITDAAGKPLDGTSAQLSPPTSVPSHWKSLITPLEKALKGGPSLDAQIGAVIARTLGGADDSRSPRAPGMLHALAHSMRVSSDTLALIGWISPSGVNRSGWLDLAYRSAQTTHDDRTKAFVNRQRVTGRVNAHLPDWAMSSARAAGLYDATDAEAALLRATIANALGTDALDHTAMSELAPYVEESPESAPSALIDAFAQIAQAHAPSRARAARRLLAARGKREALYVEAMAEESKDAVVDAAQHAFDGGIESAEEGVSIARVLCRAGEVTTAERLLTRLVDWAPNHAQAWGMLAEVLGSSSAPVERRGETSLYALRRARELAPGETRYRAELSLRAPNEISEFAREDEHYLVPAETILARRKGVPPSGALDAADRQLHWLRAVLFHPDRRVSQLIHYAREIFVEPQTQRDLIEELPNEGDLTELVRARVHRKEGGTALPTEEYDDGATPQIRWPELHAGDVVEVALRTWTSGPIGGRGDAPFYFLDYAGSTTTHPLSYNEVVVESPPDHPIYIDILHSPPDRREERDEHGRHVIRLVWDSPVTVADEPLAPALSETIPVVLGSTFRTWTDFRAWYAEAVKGFTEPDAEIVRLAAQLTEGKTSSEAKLASLFEFVADDIRYVNYVSGESWLPNRPQHLLARREGDCDDKAILLITLLRAVGRPSSEVLVQTRLTGQPSVLRAKGVAVPLFDHGIAVIDGPKGEVWLDATGPQSRLGPLPSMDARGVAFRMDGPAEIIDLPPGSTSEHGADIRWTIELQPNGAADLSADERYTGDSAYWLRSSLTETGARHQFIEEYAARWFPTVEVDPMIEFKGDLPQGKAQLTYRVHSEGYARHEESAYVVPLAPSLTFASQLAPLPTRTLPVVLPPNVAPSHDTRTVRLIAPEGFHWERVPPSGVEDGGEFGRARFMVELDPHFHRALLITREIVWDASTIPTDRYVAWRGWIQRIDRLTHRDARLVADDPPRSGPSIIQKQP